MQKSLTFKLSEILFLCIFDEKSRDFTKKNYYKLELYYLPSLTNHWFSDKVIIFLILLDNLELKMSLFQAREWWTTWCGGADEEFDQGSLCIANIDNNPNGFGE